MQHVISVTVENKPGVLSRISSMFARRGFNIHSMAVGPSAERDGSRMTLVIDGPEMEQIVKQLRKLINTIKVTEFDPGEAIERELCILRVSAPAARRSEVLDVAAAFGAEPVDVGAATVAFEMGGTPSQLSDFLEVMRPYGIVESVKSGRIALGRDIKNPQATLRAAG